MSEETEAMIAAREYARTNPMTLLPQEQAIVLAFLAGAVWGMQNIRATMDAYDAIRHAERRQ